MNKWKMVDKKFIKFKCPKCSQTYIGKKRFTIICEMCRKKCLEVKEDE